MGIFTVQRQTLGMVIAQKTKLDKETSPTIFYSILQHLGGLWSVIKVLEFKVVVVIAFLNLRF